jgi:hypothetical protein
MSANANPYRDGRISVRDGLHRFYSIGFRTNMQAEFENSGRGRVWNNSNALRKFALRDYGKKNAR